MLVVIQIDGSDYRRAGDLRPVDIPRVEAEALREVVHAREEVLKDLKAATNLDS